MNDRKALLLVANYDSDVGYAWWLMESFWAKLAEHYSPYVEVILAYPHISTLPKAIAAAPLKTVEQNFSESNLYDILTQCQFLRHYKVKAIYFSDKPTWHWRYILYRLYGVRLIITHDHTPGTRSTPHGLKAWLKKLVHRLPCLSVDGAIGATEFVRQRLIHVNGMSSKRCFAAPNGLPAQNHLPMAVDLHGLFQIPNERKTLVMAARASRYKGVKFILDCLTELHVRGRKDIHFIFIGDGPDLDYFKATAKKIGVLPHCTFPGRREDVSNLLEAANIAMHPSKGEVGYSLSILEYMRAGLPVLVPDNPSVCGATTHGVDGMVFPEGDIQVAVTILESLLDDEALRKSLGARAHITSKKYSLTTSHSALLNAFEKIDRKNILKLNEKGFKNGA